MGAYFVRRNSSDPLYRKVLERYVGMATAAGVTQAVFPEGGLSRDGKLRPPKLGILDYMLRAFDPAGERDIVFVPVGINYDRTFEDRTLLAELDAAFEAPGRRGAVREHGALRRTESLAHGAQPLAPLRLRLRQLRLALSRSGSTSGAAASTFAALPREERSRRLEELARELMEAVARVIPAVPVPLVATVFVREPGQARGASSSSRPRSSG